MYNFEDSRKDSIRGISLPRVRVRKGIKTIIIIINEKYINMIVLVPKIRFDEQSKLAYTTIGLHDNWPTPLLSWQNADPISVLM